MPPDVGFVPTDVGCTPVLLPRSSRLESLWSEQKELKVKGLESLWSEKKELKELKVKCGWPAAGLRQSNICGWPAAGLRQSNMLEKLHKTQSPRRFQHAFNTLQIVASVLEVVPARAVPVLRQQAGTSSSIEGRRRPNHAIRRRILRAAGLRLACGWPAAVKHARKAPQNPVPTALSTHFVLYTHTHTHGATHASSIAETSSSIHAQDTDTVR